MAASAPPKNKFPIKAVGPDHLPPAPVFDTPLMRQYHQLKQQHPGALLLFRVGDFYVTFGEDAVTSARLLDITLTKRGAGTASEVALAGFPHHALDTYLPKLVRAGQRVAICDQLEDPKQAKGLVKRGITELITPGVSLHDQTLERFLVALEHGVEARQRGGDRLIVDLEQRVEQRVHQELVTQLRVLVIRRRHVGVESIEPRDDFGRALEKLARH